MRMLNFCKPGEEGSYLGTITSHGRVVDLMSAYASYLYETDESDPLQLAKARLEGEIMGFIVGGESALQAAKTAVQYVEDKKEDLEIGSRDSRRILFSQDEIKFLPPVLRPSKMICIGANYEDHLAEAGLTRPNKPMAFAKIASAFVGHKGEIILTEEMSTLDYEIELAFVIGKKGKYIEKTKAMEYVYGYTILNDISERDFQISEMKRGTLFGGKNMDTFAPLGPWVVTSDEIQNPHDLEMVLRVNGEIRQKSSTKNMIFRIEEQIAYWSRFMTLFPGDIFSTGTPAGVAFGRGPEAKGYYLKDGDVVEAEIEKVGILQNRVVSEERSW